jgi:hypothetical protein
MANSKILQPNVPTVLDPLTVKEPDPYRYTSGRWLDKESSRMRSRHIPFNFPALLEVALKAAPGAESIIKWEKLEGGFNRTFILHLNNGSKVVARIPFRHAGPQRLATNSEVATLSYCMCRF